jgi:hypothetical protein
MMTAAEKRRFREGRNRMTASALALVGPAPGVAWVAMHSAVVDETARSTVISWALTCTRLHCPLAAVLNYFGS